MVMCQKMLNQFVVGLQIHIMDINLTLIPKEWEIDNSVNTPLYQVPIIRSDDNSMGPLDYGTY